MEQRRNVASCYPSSSWGLRWSQIVGLFDGFVGGSAIRDDESEKEDTLEGHKAEQLRQSGSGKVRGTRRA